MDDTVKGVIYGFLGLIVFHAALEKRAERDVTREVRDAFRGSGRVNTASTPSGMFGAIGNRFYAIDIYGSGLKTEELPFVAIPRGGWKGHIQHLRLHFDDLTLKGLPIERFEADIPNVSYDLGQALYKDRLVVRGAGSGPSSVRIGSEGLRVFILRKFSRTLSEVQVTFRDQTVVISGKLKIFGAQSPFEAVGSFETRDGRYVDLVRPTAEMNGQPLSLAVMANVLKQLNPVLDVSTDLGLGSYMTLSHVTIGDNAVTIFGNAHIPLRGAIRN